MRANGDGDTPSIPFGSWGFFANPPSPILLRQSSFANPPSPRLRRTGGDDGHDRSFITREFNGVVLKENGTIPF
jgi:hypothetical protein